MPAHETPEAIPADSATPGLTCRNCGAKLQGKFCHQCGQREDNRNIRFLTLAREVASDVFDWDAGFWKTLVALLFKPGFLSAEYFAGRKARYLPPVRLYLAISFIMFLLISVGSSRSVVTVDGELDANKEQELVSALEQKLDSSDLSEEEKNQLRADIDKKVEKFRGSYQADSEENANQADLTLDFWQEGEKPTWATNLEERFATNIQKVRERPALLIEAFVDRLPYLMFLLLPLFALLVNAAYLFSPFHYLQHLVFSLHYHSAIFLIITLGILIDVAFDIEVGGWLGLWSLAYLPIALKRNYQSSAAGAVGKSVMIGIGELILLFTTVSALAVGSIVTL